MSTTLKKLLFFVCAIVVSILSSNLQASQLHLSEDVMARIILNESYCVQTYDEDKIYLKHENIYPMENGLFLDLNGIESIPLSYLNSDSRGCWIPNALVNDYPTFQKCRE